MFFSDKECPECGQRSLDRFRLLGMMLLIISAIIVFKTFVDDWSGIQARTQLERQCGSALVNASNAISQCAAEKSNQTIFSRIQELVQGAKNAT